MFQLGVTLLDMTDDAWDSLFCAHLPPIPVLHFASRPADASSGEWAPGSFKAGQAPATASSAVTQESHKHIGQLVKDLDLVCLLLHAAFMSPP